MLASGIKSYANEIAQVNDNVEKLQKLIGEGQDADPEWQDQSLDLVTKLNNPIHSMILSWHDWWLS